MCGIAARDRLGRRRRRASPRPSVRGQHVRADRLARHQRSRKCRCRPGDDRHGEHVSPPDPALGSRRPLRCVLEADPARVAAQRSVRSGCRGTRRRIPETHAAPGFAKAGPLRADGSWRRRAVHAAGQRRDRLPAGQPGVLHLLRARPASLACCTCAGARDPRQTSNHSPSLSPTGVAAACRGSGRRPSGRREVRSRRGRGSPLGPRRQLRGSPRRDSS